MLYSPTNTHVFFLGTYRITILYIHRTIIFYAEIYSEQYIEVQIKSHSAHIKIL